MSDLRQADVLESPPIWLKNLWKDMADAAAELRKLHDLLGKCNALCRIRAERIEELEAELVEQARLNGMGSEREARLMSMNAELVEAVKAERTRCAAIAREFDANGQSNYGACIAKRIEGET